MTPLGIATSFGMTNCEIFVWLLDTTINSVVAEYYKKVEDKKMHPNDKWK